MAITLDSQVAYASATKNITIPVPSWADYAIFTLDISANGGTSPGPSSFLIQYKSPFSATYTSITAASDSIATTGTAAHVVGLLGASVSGTGVDATAFPLTQFMRAILTFDRTQADETYTYKFGVEFRKVGAGRNP